MDDTNDDKEMITILQQRDGKLIKWDEENDVNSRYCYRRRYC